MRSSQDATLMTLILISLGVNGGGEGKSRVKMTEEGVGVGPLYFASKINNPSHFHQ